MNRQTLKADSLLLLAAIIWGFAFVAQRIGMDFVGPFLFNGVRFVLGALVLLPFILRSRRASRSNGESKNSGGSKLPVLGGMLAGLLVFGGASFQQVGLVYTTAGKAGFITGLYVVFVPLLGLFFRQRPGSGTWIGAVLAAVGLYFLSVTESLTIDFGDLLVLCGACIWACHVLVIGWLSPRVDALKLACTQYLVCAALSLTTAVCVETISIDALWQAAWPIFYGGALSVGIAYTLQVLAQKKAPPAHAAILLSLEAVFAALGGWIVLGEILSLRGLAGCALMLFGMLASQLWGNLRRNS
ncbi:MAG: DMT family transporter [Planctomycetota bacterium]|jgi:drug/metabolite transporter (DMT)-like permease